MSDTDPPAFSEPLLTADDLVVDRALVGDDPDELAHQPVADRIAELAMHATPPVNIALFGPWGSGKSSLVRLLQRSLDDRKASIRLVHYDAWMFAGESLQRNFISHVAAELGLPSDREPNREFYAGLYERKRSANVAIDRRQITKFIAWAAGIAGAILLSLAGLTAAITHLTNGDAGAAFVSALASLLPSSAFLGVLTAIGKELFVSARIDVELSAPTQEQFRSTFGRLVERGLKEAHVDRIVFFIDELDRCRPIQVGEVLAAIRHFFDQPHCMFIVAADRQALERALDELPQPRPIDQDTPYYSSASAYLDKIFQHQLYLPPLRARRLQRYARNLVESRGRGLWAELRNESDRLMDDVIEAVIPTHVVSPRRVKVLLNNFATNCRLVQSRGFEWHARATEIAKLTVLQTEFPALAADLHLEPRLPAMLLSAPKSPSPRTKSLLKKHRLIKRGESAKDVSAADPLIAEARNEKEAEELLLVAGQQRVQLRRYLLRVADTPDPGRDLLYLEPGGASVQMEDAAFGDLLETVSVDDPKAVLAAAGKQPPAERQKALRVLADVLSDAFGRERVRVASALLGIAEELNYDVGHFGSDVVRALNEYVGEEQLEPAHLAPALAIAIREERGRRAPLTARIFSDPRLMADSQQLQRLIEMAHLLHAERRQVVWARAAEFYPTAPHVLAAPLRELPADVAQELLENPNVEAAIRARADELFAASPSEATQQIEPLFDAIASRTDGRGQLAGKLLYSLLSADSDATYSIAELQREQLLTLDDQPALRNLCALTALTRAPAEHWAHWAEHLRPTESPEYELSNPAQQAIANIFERWDETEGDADELRALIVNLAQFVPSEDDKELAVAVRTSLVDALAPTDWRTNESDRKDREQLLKVAFSLAEGRPGPVQDAVAGAAAKDLEGALQTGVTIHPLILLRVVGGALPGVAAPRVARALAALVPSTEGSDLTRARLAVLAGARRRSIPIATKNSQITVDQIRELAELSPIPQVAIGNWLVLDPSVTDAAEIARSLREISTRAERTLFVEWASRRSPAERTDFLLAVADETFDASEWVEAISAHEIDEERFITVLSSRVQNAARGDERDALVRTAAASRPTTGEGQRALADLIIWLVDQDRRTDWESAGRALRQLGKEHRRGPQLAKSFLAARDRGRDLTRRVLQDLSEAGVRFTRAQLGKEKASIWRLLRRR